VLGLDRSTIHKLSVKGSMKSIRLKSSLCEIYHENTKLTPTMGRYYGALAAAFLRMPALRKLTSAPFKKYTLMDREVLPAIRPSGQLEETIVARRSRRAFSGQPATVEQLSRLLYLTYGRTAPGGLFRPIASGGGLYPLEFYVTVINVDGLAPGLYHYDVEEHHLDAIRRAPADFEELEELLWLQDVEDPTKLAMIIYVSAILQRSTMKYGDRGYRLILMEAGEAVHNLALLAQSMELGCCPLGGFMDNALSEYLDVDGVDEVPLVPVCFGQPTQ
jgi:SagB-type dehydrogenase family enzyme